ncbi:hypothetical protein SteCoe_22459 [Stentor coeruleus]|uniref:Uncharacterized protein n=1 Tax=Stentor coeruleus TaxID=5963 RepID=A0A1R2BM07_9CILI|nr:hypothetical protein SteCoe_22459 [Stentor coeruleus]
MDKKRKLFLKNDIKILPTAQPELQEDLASNFLNPKPKNSLRSLNRHHVVSLPKLTKLNSKLYKESKSFNNLLQNQSVISINHSLIEPKIKDKNYMMGEIEKIISQCNDDSFKNDIINEQLLKTENEMTEIVDKISRINEYNSKPKSRFRYIVRKKEPPLNRNSIRELIKNMKRMYIKIRAI